MANLFPEELVVTFELGETQFHLLRRAMATDNWVTYPTNKRMHSLPPEPFEEVASECPFARIIGQEAIPKNGGMVMVQIGLRTVITDQDGGPGWMVPAKYLVGLFQKLGMFPNDFEMVHLFLD